MRLDENEEAAEILYHVSFSTIFDTPKYNSTLNLALLGMHFIFFPLSLFMRS